MSPAAHRSLDCYARGMREWSLGVLVAAASAWLCACDDALPAAQQVQACPAGVETCQGADDCVSGCVCEGSMLATCMDRCGGRGGPYVSALDQGEWRDAWTAFEDEVLTLTNAARAAGGCCGDEGCFPPSEPLVLDARLRRAARAHARDMGTQEYFDHRSPDGRTPFDRMREAGFQRCAMGENIAAGQPTPQSVMDDWMNSDGHCANILQPSFELLGVGYYEHDEQSEWVQNFGG